MKMLTDPSAIAAVEAETARLNGLSFDKLVAEMREMEEQQLGKWRDSDPWMRQFLIGLERSCLVDAMLEKLGLEIWGEARAALRRPDDDRFVEHALARIAEEQRRRAAQAPKSSQPVSESVH
jgi:hypothetical protein